MKSAIVPKLSTSQSETLNKLLAGLRDHDAAARVARRQARAKGVEVVPQPASNPLLHVDTSVQLLRDVVGTAYRAGQRGKIIALHNLPSACDLPGKSLKAMKVVAEVVVSETSYADTVSIEDLKALL